MVKECSLPVHTGILPLRDLPTNSLVKITYGPDMTSAVCSGRKATNQTNKQIIVNCLCLNFTLSSLQQ